MAGNQAGPKKYGDKIAAELSGPDGGPIRETLTVEYLKRVLYGGRRGIKS